MGMLQEFKKFALKGSMVDMAVGIIIGSSFSTAIKSLVDNVMMPPIGYLTGKVDFSKLSIDLPVSGSENVEIKYGLFINSLISLLIVAVVLFAVVKAINRARDQFESEEPTAPTKKSCPECRMEIPADATRCGHCTTPLVAGPSS